MSANKSLKGLTGGWSKWGGAKKSIWVNQHERLERFWICQSCGKQEPKQIPPFLYQYPFEEYLRVCAVCFNNNCIELKNRID